MMINEEPVRVAIQQSAQMIEETLAANMRRFKGKRRDVRRKRSTREAENHINLYNQAKFYSDDSSYYRQLNGSDKVQPGQFQYQFTHYNQQSYQQHQHQLQQFNLQQQQQQVPPTSPLHITPPISSSSHPLSSFQTSNHQQVPTSNGHPLVMYPSQLQMPLPMQFPMPMPVSMPPVNYDGSMPVQLPLQMPIHMPNMPLPMFIRLPGPPCVSPAASSSSSSSTSSDSEANYKSNISSGGIGLQQFQPPPQSTTVVNFIPLMFPSHLGPMLLGPSQPVMVARMSPNFHQMVNETNQHRSSIHQQSQTATK